MMKSKFFTQLIKQIIFVAVLFVGTAVNGQTKLVDFFEEPPTKYLLASR